jgi:hypothetical protein
MTYFSSPTWHKLESDGGMILTGEPKNSEKKTCPSATLCTTNPTWTDPGAKPGLCGERPATNRLRHGTVWWLVCLPLEPQFAGSNQADSFWGLMVIKHRMSWDFTASYRSFRSIKKRYFERLNSSFPSPVPPALRLDDSPGRIARELWLMTQQFFPVDIIPPWISMLIYLLENEQ